MHKCVRCGKEFENLTEDLLSGCPECGGKLFLYVRDMESAVFSGVEVAEDEELEEADEERIEGLRILSPGVYELNLPSLLQRKEIILKLRSTYAIHLPSLFRDRSKFRERNKKR